MTPYGEKTRFITLGDDFVGLQQREHDFVGLQKKENLILMKLYQREYKQLGERDNVSDQYDEKTTTCSRRPNR